MNEIADKEKPDVITLNDTNLKGKLKVKVPGYFSFGKNREKFKGGVATVIANHLKNNTMKVTAGQDDDEYIITRFDNTVPPVNIVNIYGQQESRTTDSEIEKSWLRLMKDVGDIESKNESIVIIGDMNRAIGNDQYGIQGNKSKVSFGGQLIRNILKDGRYVLINNLDMVEGGPWTWTDRKDNKRQSCLDLAIISSSLLPFLHKVEIDKDKKFTPRRVLKRKQNIMTIFTDHFSLKIELKGIPRRTDCDKIEAGWNLGKPGGWKAYKTITDEVSDKVKNIVGQEDLDVNSVLKKIYAIDTKVKFRAFGKTKPSVKTYSTTRKCMKMCEIHPCDNCKNQKEKDEETYRRQTQRIELAIEQIRESKQGRVGNVFMLKRNIAGPNKTPQEAAAVRDPINGELLVNKSEIKETTLTYCINNLKNNIPD